MLGPLTQHLTFAIKSESMVIVSFVVLLQTELITLLFKLVSDWCVAHFLQ